MQPLQTDFRTGIRGLLEDLEELDRDLERADMLIWQCGHCQNRPNRQKAVGCL